MSRVHMIFTIQQIVFKFKSTGRKILKQNKTKRFIPLGYVHTYRWSNSLYLHVVKVITSFKITSRDKIV